jgi:hypothetical protein
VKKCLTKEEKVERRKIYSRKYYLGHRKEMLKSFADYRKKNPLAFKNWYYLHREKIVKDYKNNVNGKRDRLLAYGKRYYQMKKREKLLRGSFLKDAQHKS